MSSFYNKWHGDDGTKVNHPGLFAEIHDPVTDIFKEKFVGMQIINCFLRTKNNQFGLYMDSLVGKKPPGFGLKMFCESAADERDENRTTLNLFQFDMNSVNAEVQHYISRNSSFNFEVDICNTWNTCGCQMCIQYLHKKYTCSFFAHKPKDLKPAHFGGNCLVAISDKLALGIEYCQSTDLISKIFPSLGMRYTDNKNYLAFSSNIETGFFTYCRALNPYTHVAAKMNIAGYWTDCCFGLGFKYNWPVGDKSLNVSYDTKKNLCLVFSNRLSGTSLFYSLCAHMEGHTKEFKLGLRILLL